MTVTHRMSKTRTYRSWRKMRERCLNPKTWQYKYYGGLGVTICKRWEKFENFLADMGERPEGMSLDRINTYGNYTPKNCRWASATQQARGQKKTILIRGKTLRDICEQRGLVFGTVYQRYRSGLPMKAVLHDGPLYPWPFPGQRPLKINARHGLAGIS